MRLYFQCCFISRDELYCVFKLYDVTILYYQIFTNNELVTSSFSCIENYISHEMNGYHISHTLIHLEYISLF